MINASELITENELNSAKILHFIIHNHFKNKEANVDLCRYNYSKLLNKYDHYLQERNFAGIFNIMLYMIINKIEIPEFIWNQAINITYNSGLWEISSLLNEAKSKYIHLEYKNHKPDFIIIGTMKGGTTTLYNYLCMHPKIINRQPKELHYFTINYDKGLDYYIKFFSEKTRYHLIGEASPSYFDWETPRIAERIKNFKENIKLILILTDPVKRAISQYYHDLRIKKGAALGSEFVSKQDILTIDKIKHLQKIKDDSFIRGGFYEKRMHFWDEFIKNGNLIILTQSELQKDPNSVLNKTCDFLNIEKFPLNAEKLKKYNVNKYPKPNEEIITYLSNLYSKTKEFMKKQYGISF